MTQFVIACIDPSPYAEAVCDYAVWAAKQLQAPLTMLHAIDKAQHTQTPDLSGSIGLGSQEVLLQQLAELDEKHSKLALERGRLMLDAAKARAEQAGVASVDERLRHGSLVESLKATEDDTRLVVMGKRGLSSADAHGQLGLHVEQVIRSLHRPILLTQQHFKTPQRIMLAFDGSATAQKSLDMLAASPLCKGLPVHLVFAGMPEQAPALDEAAILLQQAGFETKTAVVAGDPEEVLHQYQQEHHIDLLIMGAYGHSRIRQFIVGSTTTAMLSKAKCSLLILR
ncbi:universal stress protein [Rheinheimera sp. UJ51]|uniref:universal stress protein n=1 Tax=unclassified Rheinheimera TaxID=115860 RepID=UPI001E325CE7|nr:MULTISPECIES: universal stress protein [unclassified Rheinheimera]MCC5452485.1 universal stress protein [Rheinheimera sp. UJ51]MCF4010304.1 universal stress protein [Rheinheimera sp. UJ63]